MRVRHTPPAQHRLLARLKRYPSFEADRVNHAECAVDSGRRGATHSMR